MQSPQVTLSEEPYFEVSYDLFINLVSFLFSLLSHQSKSQPIKRNNCYENPKYPRNIMHLIMHVLFQKCYEGWYWYNLSISIQIHPSSMKTSCYATIGFCPYNTRSLFKLLLCKTSSPSIQSQQIGHCKGTCKAFQSYVLRWCSSQTCSSLYMKLQATALILQDWCFVLN